MQMEVKNYAGDECQPDWLMTITKEGLALGLIHPGELVPLRFYNENLMSDEKREALRKVSAETNVESLQSDFVMSNLYAIRASVPPNRLWGFYESLIPLFKQVTQESGYTYDCYVKNEIVNARQVHLIRKILAKKIKKGARVDSYLRVNTPLPVVFTNLAAQNNDHYYLVENDISSPLIKAAAIAVFPFALRQHSRILFAALEKWANNNSEYQAALEHAKREFEKRGETHA